jgi:predicted Fe-Mo cluster-binding NifX family protein
VKIAIASDEGHVASGFGCAPFYRIVDVVDGQAHDTLIMPNPGIHHEFLADLFVRNSIAVVIAGSMGPTARAVLMGAGIQPILGVKGEIDEVIRRFAAGELHGHRPTADHATCGESAE